MALRVRVAKTGARIVLLRRAMATIAGIIKNVTSASHSSTRSGEMTSSTTTIQKYATSDQMLVQMKTCGRGARGVCEFVSL